MKQRLTLLLTALLLLTGITSWGQIRTEASIDFSQQGYSNGLDLGDSVIVIDDNVTIVFHQGSGNNSPKYYNTGAAIRAYGGNNFVVSSTGTITSITLTFGTGDGSNAITTEVGTYTAPTWEGSSNEVTFTVGGTSGHRRVKGVAVIYTTGGGQQETVATPSFNPAEGTYFEPQSVSISCTTEDADIYYTTDGTEPTEGSTLYSDPIAVTETTTLKAKAFKSGYTESNIATATYTFPTLITIAEAKTLANNEYAMVQGIVTFIDSRNVYIQDSTGGIDLYLNANASNLDLGDEVKAYGKKTVYNGLIELTGINQSSSAFSVLSTGNTLPLEVKTIAEILEGGADALQSTRVMIEGATIGTINTGGNTPLTQDENSINIYKVPALSGIEEGDVVDVIGVIGYHNAPQIRVAQASDVVLHLDTDPHLYANSAALTGFTYDYEQGGPSEIQYFELSGERLMAPVAIYPSENFEVSTIPSTVFHPENPAMVFVSGSGLFHDLKIYVRMKAGLEGGTYSEQVYAVSEGADTLFVNVEGIVTGGTPTPPDPPTPPMPPTPGDGNYVRINDLSLLTEGSLVVFAARFDSNATDYYAMSNASSGKPTGVLFTSATVDENEVLPASIVDEESNYYWTVGVTANGYTFTNANSELIGYSSSTNFATGGDNTEWAIEQSTAGDGAMVPEYTGFVISNFNNTLRAFALNNNHNFGPYHTQNINGSSYNFYLDLFVKTEGGDPPTPTVATPTFTPNPGTYFETQEVTISCATADATLYYSTFSENGPWTPYTGAITVEETTTFWAYAEMEGYNNSNVATATYTIQLGVVTIFNQDWEGEMNGWTFVDVTGEASWSVATYQGNHYAYANGYNHGANVDWCISPDFNLDAYSNPILSFRTAKNYTGNDLEVYFSNDYDGEDPTNATWQLLVCPLSSGSWTWVESGDISLSNFNGSECYIGFKYTCEESSAAGWEVDDILLVGATSTPVITVTPTSLTGFTYIEGNGPSAEQSFVITGMNLVETVTIVNPEGSNFEISTTSGDDFVNNPNITLNNDFNQTIYVRLAAGLPEGSYTANLVVDSELDDINISLSGTVTEQPAPVDDYVRITGVSELAAGNRVILAARYNETTDAYFAIGNTLSSGKLGTTAFTSLMNGDEEIIPADILADEDNYYWTVDVTADSYTFTNANGDMIGYGNSGTNFVMNGEKTVWTINDGISDTASMVPEYFGFLITNATTTNRAFALRFYNEAYICGAYSTSNLNNSQAGEYNYYLDIFMQGEGGVPPTPTVAAPTFDPVGGTYYEAQVVTISCSTADAAIHYSFDSESGPWTDYEEPIMIDENTIIWAYASKDDYNDSPIVSAEYIIQDDIVIIFNQDWEEDWNGWTEYCEMGDSLWHIASHQGNQYAYANGYNHPASIDWLISPAFDLDSYDDVVLTFRTAQNYTGPDLELLFSNDYDGQDPTVATWETLECTLSQGGWNWVESGEISLEAFSGTNCHIAFKYTCTDDEAAAWEVDDIMLTSGGISTNPFLIATPNALSGMTHIVEQGPSVAQTFNLTGGNFLPAPEGGYGYVVLTLGDNSPFQISLDDEEYTSALYIEIGEDPTLDTTIFVRLWGDEVGLYDWTLLISSAYSSLNVYVTLSGEVLSGNEPAIEFVMPLYIQGNNGSNNNRVPVAIPALLNNFEPNTTYRYTNQLVDGNDSPETAGAGNVIYVSEEGFYRSTNPSLGTEGGYGEFTTDDEGIAFVWFMNESTANARFTPGNNVYLRVRINDGNEGTSVAQTFTSNDPATVINFGTENDGYSGTAFYVKSNEAPMSFALMYDDYEDYRPLYITSIESTGVDYGSINQYADFYKDEVVGNDGWFGGILPNDNETGVTYILVTSMDAQTHHEYVSEDGQWYPEANTINPNGGLDEPIFIDLTDNGVDDIITANLKVWSTDHEFVIENGEDSRFTMNVVNVLGQNMMSQEIAANSTTHVGHNLTPGIYIINLSNNLNRFAVKVFVR